MQCSILSSESPFQQSKHTKILWDLWVTLNLRQILVNSFWKWYETLPYVDKTSEISLTYNVV